MIQFSKRNLGIKALSLFSAFILWLYVGNQYNPNNEQVLANIPLEFEALDEDLAVIDVPQSVNIRVQGNRLTGQKLTLQQVRASVNLNDVGVGENFVGVQVKVPEGYRLVSVTPDRVNIEIDEIREKQVPIIVDYLGKTMEGYNAMEPVLTPESLIIRGPRQLLEEVEEAFVEVNLQNLSKHYNQVLPPRLLTSGGREFFHKSLAVSPVGIEVFVPIVKELPSKEVSINPIIVGVPEEGYRIGRVVIEPSNIVVSGTPELLSKITSLSTEAIDIQGATKNINREVRVISPSGLTWSGSNRVKVLVEVMALPIPIKEGELPLGIENLSEELSLVGELPKIMVSWQEIKKPGPERVKVWLDLEGLTAGKHEVPVQIKMPPELKLEALGTLSVNVELVAKNKEEEN